MRPHQLSSINYLKGSDICDTINVANHQATFFKWYFLLVENTVLSSIFTSEVPGQVVSMDKCQFINGLSYVCNLIYKIHKKVLSLRGINLAVLT